MGALPLADVIELEQLLAKYAVSMTKNDVEAVVEVFTPDGSYSAFGDTYALADFPTLVAAAPKGLFMVGPPVPVPASTSRSSTGGPTMNRPFGAAATRVGKSASA